MRQKVISVAIVGAGAGGLCALRHLASNQSKKNPNVSFKAVAYEQTARIGGTWVYTDRIHTDELGQPVHSSMYKNLKTNLPKECMGYPDHDFPKHLPSFVGHADIQDYLEDYATRFNLWKHIKFQRFVKLVKPMFDSAKQFGVQWEVTTVDSKTNGDQEKEIFDAVLVCNGHYFKPIFPDIQGLDSYQGHVIHSHDYREPSPYKDQTVVVLGAGASGQDIAVEVSRVAKQVYLSHNKGKLPTYLPPNVKQKPGIKYCHSDVLEFHDSSMLPVDSLILCTGYHYAFDFLSKDAGIEVEDGRVTPLYKHFLHCRLPSLGFVGIPKSVIPMPMFDLQVQFFSCVLDGSCTLPSTQEMLDDSEAEYKEMRNEGLPHRYTHTLAYRQFAYNKNLAKMADITPIPDVVENVYKACHVLRAANIVNYRNNNFEVESDGRFRLIDEIDSAKT